MYLLYSISIMGLILFERYNIDKNRSKASHISTVVTLTTLLLLGGLILNKEKFLVNCMILTAFIPTIFIMDIILSVDNTEFDPLPVFLILVIVPAYRVCVFIALELATNNSYNTSISIFLQGLIENYSSFFVIIPVLCIVFSISISLLIKKRIKVRTQKPII